MLLQLTPDQAAMYWPDLRKVLEETVPVAGHEAQDKWGIMQRALMCGDMQAWIGTVGKTLHVIVITDFLYDVYTQIRSLNIHGLKGFAALTDPMYMHIALILRAWAVKNRCQRFVGFTSNTRLIDVAERLFKADTSYRFVDIPLV